MRHVQTFMTKALVAMSFLMIPVYLLYIVYFSLVCHDLSSVIIGCLSLCVMIHLNKSL